MVQKRPKSKRHPLFNTWANFVARCRNESHPRYADYGGRGIRVCVEWSPGSLDHNIRPSPFWTFASWVRENLGRRPAGLQLDRIDNDGHYEPGNLRWATPTQQNQNRRSVLLTPQKAAAIRDLRQSSSLTNAAIAHRFGVSRVTVSSVISNKQWR